MDFKQINDLIKLVSKSNLAELKIEQDNFKITLKKAPEPAANQQPVSAQPAQITQSVPRAIPVEPPAAQPEKPSEEKSDNSVIIKSPMIGTFYRAPAPDKEPFIKVGDVISKGDHICIIEAMKLFNEIESEVNGKVVKVLAEDATPVEYDQPLFLIDPTGV